MPARSPPDQGPERLFIPGEDPADFRTRVRAAQDEQAARRRQDLLAQRSTLHAPAVRIRMWERLHHAQLPDDPDHGLVAIIANGTNLSADEIRAEQERRLAARTPPPAAS